MAAKHSPPWAREGVLLLEDGRRFHGLPFGWTGTRFGEAVFSTAMAGYQEALTDPSYAGQILCLTVPHVGNYGVNPEDIESRRLPLVGFIVTSASERHSNWRARGSLDDLLRSHRVPGLEQVDTRALVRHLREKGSLRAVIANDGTPLAELEAQLAAYPGIDGRDLTREVTVEAPTPFVLEEHESPPNPVRQAARPLRVAAIDLGLKRTIARNLAWRGCRVTLFPSHTEAREILDFAPDGVFLSNGPGNPARAEAAIATVRRLLDQRDLPIFGICLGHQILSLALGGTTRKLPFGHRGTNHPVQEIATGRVWITSQNHGYTVAELPEAAAEITYRSLHDQTIEGLRVPGRPIFSVQFHPEASPGPRDALPLFDRFIEDMEG